MSEEEKLARRINDEVHVVNRDYKRLGWLSTINILWTSTGDHRVFARRERPPYPILLDKPYPMEVLPYFSKGDAIILPGMLTLGTVFGYIFGRKTKMVQARLFVLRTITRMFTIVGIGVTCIAPLLRISGYWENGLRWRRPNPPSTYTFTSEFYRHPIYKHFGARKD